MKLEFKYGIVMICFAILMYVEFYVFICPLQKTYTALQLLHEKLKVELEEINELPAEKNLNFQDMHSLKYLQEAHEYRKLLSKFALVVKNYPLQIISINYSANQSGEPVFLCSVKGRWQILIPFLNSLAKTFRFMEIDSLKLIIQNDQLVMTVGFFILNSDQINTGVNIAFGSSVFNPFCFQSVIDSKPNNLFSFKELKWVGLMICDNNKRVLLKQPDGSSVEAKIGDRLGKEFAQIKNITTANIELLLPNQQSDQIKLTGDGT